MNVIFPERRSERRYVTLKNAAIAGVAVVVLFLILSIWSAFRPHSRSSGNLFSTRAQPADPMSIRRAPMIVTEGSTGDHPGADSLLLDGGAAPASPVPVPTTAAEPTNFEPRTSQLGKGRRITISGGSGGVQIHAEPIAAPAASTQTSETAAPAEGIPAAQPPR